MTSVLIASAPHVYKTDRLGHMTPMDEPVHAAPGRTTARISNRCIVPAANPKLKSSRSDPLPGRTSFATPNSRSVLLDLSAVSGYSWPCVVPLIAVCWSAPTTGGNHRMLSNRPLQPSPACLHEMPDPHSHCG